jgi:cystathionine gamma-synthase
MAAGRPHLETLAVHAGLEPDPATGAVTPPIYLSTTFERDADGGYPRGYVYSRSENPNRRALEAALAVLQGGEAAAAFASGSAAASAVFRSLRPGDHAIVPVELYHGIRKLLTEALQPWGLELDWVDLSDLSAVDGALRPDTRLVWIETPSNPMLSITDIEAVARRAHAVGARVVVDATWTPPGVADPLGLGADLVVHATTKYLSGHSDVLGGAVIAAREDESWERLVFLQRNEGAVPSPFDCWLVHRGLRTLPYRMRGHQDNAGKVAAFLERHAAVERVYYPGLPDHPGHAVAARQMAGFGGMLSFTLRGEGAGGEAEAMRVAARTRLFRRATSLGGVESLIEHRASIEGPDSATPRSLLRVSVGLEHPDDLLADLAQALGG